jgi:hypothetical protein
MGESVKCDLCNGIKTPWHVIGECPGAHRGKKVLPRHGLLELTQAARN